MAFDLNQAARKLAEERAAKRAAEKKKARQPGAENAGTEKNGDQVPDRKGRQPEKTDHVTIDKRPVSVMSGARQTVAKETYVNKGPEKPESQDKASQRKTFHDEPLARPGTKRRGPAPEPVKAMPTSADLEKTVSMKGIPEILVNEIWVRYPQGTAKKDAIIAALYAGLPRGHEVPIQALPEAVRNLVRQDPSADQRSAALDAIREDQFQVLQALFKQETDISMLKVAMAYLLYDRLGFNKSSAVHDIMNLDLFPGPLQEMLYQMQDAAVRMEETEKRQQKGIG